MNSQHSRRGKTAVKNIHINKNNLNLLKKNPENNNNNKKMDFYL